MNEPAATAPEGHPRLRRRCLGGYRYVRTRWRVLFGAIDLLGTALFAAGGLLRGWARRQGGSRRPARRILLVQWDHLGDAILTTAIFRPLKRRFPEATIEVLAAPWNREVFDAVPEVDRVHVCAANRFAPGASLRWIPALFAWSLRMRRRRFDLAIDVRGEFPHNLLMWLSGARRRLGWACGGGGFFLTDRADYREGRPELDSRAALLACLGIETGNEAPEFSAHVEFADREAAFARAAWREFPSWATRRIVVHVGAGTAAKRWPVEHWRALVSKLAGRGDAAVALVGTEQDGAAARAILGTEGLPTAADWTGRLNFARLAAVLEQADVVVGADSGPAHLAAAVDTAVVVLFSGTNRLEQWRPRGRVVRTIRSPVACAPCHRRTCPIAGHPCMRRITPGEVAAAVDRLLDERPRAGAAAGTSVESS